ncbi:hypothetical protein C0Q70_13026 [Pomacea canaliculata]|uniref:SRCR domain-containing protein n=1 Tax=Pomacea canaliculata TaxID=400727 RepID=A0A2T7P364_POMCA|nr:hypothetical protein C0Q70_13026 [Pomacea canaliculata]
MGRVEILFGAAWTTPCVSTFSSSLANVLCRQMNYPSKAATAVESSSFGPRTGRFLVAGIVCTGMESNILGCFQTVTGFSDTCSSPELGVICSDSKSSLFIVVETKSTSLAYPLMEATNVTLKCVSSQRGLSHLNFSWPETAGGRPSGEYLIFDNLTRSHNGGRVRCMASYGQPPRTQIATSDTLAMDVYYRPVVRIKWEGNTCEPLESSPSRYRAHVLNFQINAEARTVVTVAENSSVRMRCEAEGRPSPHMTIVSVSNDKREVASRPRGAVQSPDQRVELTYDLTAAPCEAAGDYRCEVDNGDRGINVKVIIGAAVGTAAVLKSLSRHAEANTRQALETTVPLENMKSSGATNNYYGQNARSEVMNMPQAKDIMTEDLYVNTAELAREEYDSDHEYSDGKKSRPRVYFNLCREFHFLLPHQVHPTGSPEHVEEQHPHCGLCSVSAFQPDSPHNLVFLQDIAANIMMRSVLSVCVMFTLLLQGLSLGLIVLGDLRCTGEEFRNKSCETRQTSSERKQSAGVRLEEIPAGDPIYVNTAELAEEKDHIYSNTPKIRCLVVRDTASKPKDEETRRYGHPLKTLYI